MHPVFLVVGLAIGLALLDRAEAMKRDAKVNPIGLWAVRFIGVLAVLFFGTLFVRWTWWLQF